MICLTFDTDYMSNEDMSRFFECVSFPGKGTFFLHQPYELDFGPHEVGPHPTFTLERSWEAELASIVSAAGIKSPAGIRTHSCAYTQPFGGHLAKQGYSYMSMTTLLYETNLKPYRHPWGIWELPIYYMDNMDFCMGINWPALDHKPFQSKIIENAVGSDSLFVFDFHPLHIALNTPNYEYYTTVRKQVIEERKSAFDFAFKGYGVRSFFNQLVDAMKERQNTSYSCQEGLSRYLASQPS